MILVVICEELGVFGAIIILVLFGLLLYRHMFIAKNAPDLYGSLIATGIFAHIALQVILNIAVVTGLLRQRVSRFPSSVTEELPFCSLWRKWGLPWEFREKSAWRENKQAGSQEFHIKLFPSGEMYGIFKSGIKNYIC